MWEKMHQNIKGICKCLLHKGIVVLKKKMENTNEGTLKPLHTVLSSSPWSGTRQGHDNP